MGEPFRLGEVYRTEVLRCLELMPEEGTVLDIGCHDGTFLSQIQADFRIGIDLDIPPEKKTDFTFIHADGRWLPFTDKSFDTVFSLDVIEHIPNDQEFATSLLRVVNFGGQLIITTPNETIRLFPPLLTRMISLKWGHFLRRGYSQERLRKLFCAAGFDVTITPLRALAYRAWYLPMRALQFIAPSLVKKFIIQIARWDAKHRDGSNGFFLLHARRLQ